MAMTTTRLAFRLDDRLLDHARIQKRIFDAWDALGHAIKCGMPAEDPMLLPKFYKAEKKMMMGKKMSKGQQRTWMAEDIQIRIQKYKYLDAFQKITPNIAQEMSMSKSQKKKQAKRRRICRRAAE